MRRHVQARLNRLSAREVHAACDGEHADGGGLSLRVAGGASKWVLQFTAPSGRRREMGLGACERASVASAGRSLTQARAQARAARDLLARGADPIEDREARRQAAAATEAAQRAQSTREALTLAVAARDYHARVIEPARTSKHAAQWIASLENHVPAELWQAPVGAVSPPALLDFVAGLQAEVPETASRVRQRLEAVFDDAEFRGLSTGNPARAIRRKLREHAQARTRGGFEALPFAEVPAFMARLREQPGIAARALEFGVLTAARTGEIIGARWSEFDLAARLWSVPAARMKGGEAHAVHLSERAVAILAEQRELASEWVFPNPRNFTRALSNMAMLALLRRMDCAQRTTVHGLCRVAFSTWSNETGQARPDVVEACLAHREGDRIRAAYNRAQFAQERRALLEAWSGFCNATPAGSKVIPLGRRA